MATVLHGAAADQLKERSAAANAAAQGAPPQGDDASSAVQAAKDLAVMHPQGSIVLRGRTLTLREYGYIEGLNLQAGIGLFLEALYQLFAKAATPPSALQVRSVFTLHAVTVQWLMAQSFTPYPEDSDALEAFADQVRENAKWVARLNDIEGDALLAVWWGVNSGFFTRRFRERRLVELQAASPSGPQGSTPT